MGDTCKITMTEFRALPRCQVEEAERTCRDLMYGMHTVHDMSHVQHSLTDSWSGFSFISHPPNQLSKAYLKLYQQASMSKTSPIASSSSWNWREVQNYMAKERKLLESLAVLMLLVGGGLPRGPDLLHLRYCNAGAVERGIYIHEGSLVYITRSHETKRSTNREFYVARFLPRPVGDLLFAYLAYIRPFVNMLAQEQDPSIIECSSYLFREGPALTARPWGTDRLSNAIKKATSLAWRGQGITIQLLRQMCVGITQKHVREVSTPFNLYDDQGRDAERNVVFAWQTGHRPIQRARTYGLDGAFPSRLQPALLERYRWVSTRWHDFLGYPREGRGHISRGTESSYAAAATRLTKRSYSNEQDREETPHKRTCVHLDPEVFTGSASSKANEHQERDAAIVLRQAIAHGQLILQDLELGPVMEALTRISKGASQSSVSSLPSLQQSASLSGTQGKSPVSCLESITLAAAGPSTPVSAYPLPESPTDSREDEQRYNTNGLRQANRHASVARSDPPLITTTALAEAATSPCDSPISQMVTLDRDHRVLICTLCKVGVRPGKGIECHFRGAHRVKGGLLRSLLGLYANRQLEDPT